MVQELSFGLYYVKWSALWEALLSKVSLIDRCEFRQNGFSKLVHLAGLSIIELIKMVMVEAFE